MESTSPEEYRDIQDRIPALTEERKNIAEEIIRIQVKWMEEFAEEYPRLAMNARSIHTTEDSAVNTSFETYLRGELGTYSDDTFLLYGRMIAEYYAKGLNITELTMTNTVHLYGYAGLKEASDSK